MLMKRPAILCASLLLGAGLLLGLGHLFELRFDRGDLYPPYSTLRTDPLGASVLYESLDQVPGVSAQRYFEETFQSDDGRAHALFILGTEPYGTELLSRSEFDTLQRFVHNGGRVVIAYYPLPMETWSMRLDDTNDPDQPFPETRRARLRRLSQEKQDDNAGPTNKAAGPASPVGTNHLNSTNAAAKPWSLSPRVKRRHLDDQNQPDQKDQPDQQDQDDEESKAELLKYADLSKEWGFHWRFNHLETNEDGQVVFPNASRMASLPGLPALLPVHTALCFTNLTNGWITVYQRDKKTPVVVERKLGAGSIVLVADSYPFSNEAMFKDRSAPLLAWVLGSGRQAIFDEAHLGIVEEPGMATLMRRYQLHGLIFGLVLVAGLFVWKNSLSLVPPHPETEAGAPAVVAGRDSASGLVNLVRRGIPPAEMINVCFAEWKKSNPRQAALSPAQRRDLEELIRQQAALEPRLRRPVGDYRAISEILKRRP